MREYAERLLRVGFVPLTDEEDRDHALALAAFEYALRERRKAQDALLVALAAGPPVSENEKE